MQAAVYKGAGTIAVEDIPIPAIGPREILIRVEACGICHTDLKKIEGNLLPPPRVYGHETAGVVAAIGAEVTRFAPGDRVLVFHHIPCGHCFYCQHQLYAQCSIYKKVGVTAGYEPAGGGFAQYVRVMDWIVERGVEKVPDDITFEEASFVEPVNTCLKAIEQANPQPEDTVLVLGQGPIGLIFTMLLKLRGCRTLVSDTMAARRQLALQFGAAAAFDPRTEDIAALVKAQTEGRGADIAILATSVPGLVEQAVQATRPGSQIVLFAQTSAKERIEVSGADICVAERHMWGSYSASVDLQRASAELVFTRALPVAALITHRLPLTDIGHGIEIALHPSGQSLKVIVQPQRNV